MTSGKEALQPDSKWNIITWTLMTVITLALGLANGSNGSPAHSSSSPKAKGATTDDSDANSASAKVTSPLMDVTIGTEVVDVQKLSQLGEPSAAAYLSPSSPHAPVSAVLSIAELAEMTDDEILQAMEVGRLSQYELEDRLDDTARAVAIRRKHLASGIAHEFDINAIPFENYDYDQVKGKCCENVIGYVRCYCRSRIGVSRLTLQRTM